MRYEVVRLWFEQKPKRIEWLRYFYHYIPYGIAMVFVLMIGNLMRCHDPRWSRLVCVDAITFVLCSIVRKGVNRPRPYEQGRIALVDKKTRGQSFPSRHMVSASVICISGIYVSFGVTTLCLCVVVMALCSWMAGVHRASEIIAGIVFGLLCGWIGFWMI